MESSKKVEAYIEKHSNFSEELIGIRELILEYPFEETIKWGMPTYVYGGRNLLGMGAFKNHVGLWFFQGALLKDKKGLLRNAQEGKTKAMRQIILKLGEGIPRDDLKTLIDQTLDNQDKGLYIKTQRKGSRMAIPPELEKAFQTDEALKEGFNGLTPGKQREYAEHVGSAKKEATRLSRLTKIIPMIKAGKGLNDKYKNC